MSIDQEGPTDLGVRGVGCLTSGSSSLKPLGSAANCWPKTMLSAHCQSWPSWPLMRVAPCSGRMKTFLVIVIFSGRRVRRGGLIAGAISEDGALQFTAGVALYFF